MKDSWLNLISFDLQDVSLEQGISTDVLLQLSWVVDRWTLAGLANTELELYGREKEISVLVDHAPVGLTLASVEFLLEALDWSAQIYSLDLGQDLREANMPKTLKLLYSYSRHALNNGSSIAIRLDNDVFGCELNLFIFIEDVYNLCEFEPISAGCICVYFWHLYKTCRDANLLSRIRFANPYETSFSPKVDVDQRAGKVGNRLIGTSTNQLVLVPCNVGFHWIMTVIDPHRETVYFLDPLSHQNRDEQWKHAVDMAIRIFNASISKKGKKNPLWEIIKIFRDDFATFIGNL
ncbi:hypothetical protein C2S52_006481 [Perilla frutescens var. hirtella]|nr:hypothetical protein C2S51_009316 [Perilla frutescens var. frutescens]KAH6786929.1 hypothetical protein C2S52_006481 [Perilla frutescens var. hirtella]